MQGNSELHDALQGKRMCETVLQKWKHNLSVIFQLLTRHTGELKNVLTLFLRKPKQKMLPEE